MFAKVTKKGKVNNRGRYRNIKKDAGRKDSFIYQRKDERDKKNRKRQN